MQIICSQCSTKTTIAADIELRSFSCPSCKSLCLYKTDGEVKLIKKFDSAPTATTLYIGQKGTLENIDYVVTGILIKEVKGPYYWKEYILTPANGKGVQLFLSETDGHWIVLQEVEGTYDVKHHPGTLVYNNMTFDIYEYANTAIAYAEGIFDYELPAAKQKMDEYINPPYILSIEKENGNEATFYGCHISASTIKKAFKVPVMPWVKGVGIVEPSYFNIRYTAITALCFAILILISHYIIYKDQREKIVLTQTLSFDTYNNKDYVSAPFTLTGGSAPLSVTAYSDVSNSWASVQIGLINEITNEEVYTSKDIEYYYGYEGGENWTEGNRNPTFNLCGVAAGRYHLVITPQKSPDDTSNPGITITATWNAPSMRNAVWPIGLMVVILVGVYFLHLNFERKRWADSSYSKYN